MLLTNSALATERERYSAFYAVLAQPLSKFASLVSALTLVNAMTYL